MRKDYMDSLPCWYVVYTKPKQEDRVDSNLRAWQVETFAPKIREGHYNQYTGKLSLIVKSLFPRYVFARFAAGQLLHKILYTRGVHSVVSFDNRPCPVDDEIISVIKSRRDEDGFVRIGEDLHPGDKVVVSQGPLKNFMGIFEGRYTDDDRISVLLTTVNYQGHIVIEREMVKKAV